MKQKRHCVVRIWPLKTVEEALQSKIGFAFIENTGFDFVSTSTRIMVSFFGSSIIERATAEEKNIISGIY